MVDWEQANHEHDPAIRDRLNRSPALAETIMDEASVDGDTLEVHGQSIRLSGMDAPESLVAAAIALLRDQISQRA